jgi:hypothetical protein
MGDALLPGDAADEENVWLARVDTVLKQGVVGRGLLIFVEVDAVVDDVDSAWVDVRIGLLDIGLGTVGNGDDGIRVQDSRALHP